MRASQSIALSIAEGCGKLPSPERRRFLQIAGGSARECAAILDILRRCRVIAETDWQAGKELLVRIVAMLTRMMDTSEHVREPETECEYEYGYEYGYGYGPRSTGRTGTADDAGLRPARLSVGVRLHEEDGMLVGSCACGRVRYQIRGDLVGPITLCHCCAASIQGPALAPPRRSRPPISSFSPERIFSRAGSPAPGCIDSSRDAGGSPIFKRDDAAAEILGFRLGTLDADPGRKADLHFMVKSKVPWLDIHDSLPREEGAGPEFGERD